MIDDDDYINFFFIKKNSFLITSFLKLNFSCVYKNEIIFNTFQDNLLKNDFKKFLDFNIYKIEKLNNQFVKNINLVIFDKIFLSVEASIKKNISGNFFFEKERLNLLSKIKNEIEFNYKEFSIIHLLLKNTLINGRNLDLTKKESLINCNYFSIETEFILFPLQSIFEYQKKFDEYQISINKIISGEYLKNLSMLEHLDETEMALKIFLGNNLNEVTLLSKKVQNRGLFEKFFHLFN